jgi:flagellar motility protein MotE (MotC chaperone)
MGTERGDQLRRLAEADAHIVETERAIAEQVAQVEALRLAGKDTATAERELAAFEETLAVLQDHRTSIKKAIERIDGRSA